MKDYEQLGSFFLGHRHDLDSGVTGTDPILYDAGDLTTHAVCVGMTGSGKTGLGVTLIEEAAIDGIPTIAIDPKGDLGNLLLTFPELTPAQFRPWIDEAEAARRGRTPEAQARWTADLWRNGLARTGQDAERIGRFAAAVDRTIYTPGSRAGAPLSILRSMAAPAATAMADDELRRDRVQATVSGLLGLLRIDADPIASREQILLGTLLDRAWREGRDVDLPALIHQIQKPGFERVGVMDLESVFPAADRLGLAMAVNNLIASPGFEVWTEGAPLDIGRLLYTADGRPRVSIVSIAHLSDAERMFVVTSLLNEIVSWVRAQPGSRSLRALLYMDEILGYMPPVAEPPSKRPLLTLLKQARAQGLGLVLATQNPVDLDYKGLSNAGTWFLGRLQTERDKARVIEGLEGASAQAGATFDRSRMERLLAGLGSRVFLMNNVHEDAPVIFQTRWTLSYLSGPLTRDQIKRLSGAPPAPDAPSPVQVTVPAVSSAAAAPTPSVRPAVPAEVVERFLPVTHPAGPGEQLVYRAGLGAVAMLHYSEPTVGVDEWTRVVTLAPLPEAASGSPWAEALETPRGAALAFDDEPEPHAGFAPIPPAAQNAKTYQRWRKMLATHLYRNRPLTLWRCGSPKLVSQLGESAGAFRGRLGDALREDRNLRVQALRQKYAPKLTRLQDQVTQAEHRVDMEQSQYTQKKVQTAISFGATVVGALFGRKLASVGTVGRAATAMRGAGLAAQEHGDIARAGERVETLRERLAELEAAFQGELEALRGAVDAEALSVTEVKVAPRKSDLDIESLLLLWTPWRVRADGVAQPAYVPTSGV